MTIDLGSKARNLFLLQEAGFQVSPFFRVDQSFEEEEVLDYLAVRFPDTGLFSVRSCASLEDSDSCSFAGQFCTFLRVPREEVCIRIREVLADGEHFGGTDYSQAHHLNPAAFQMHVMIQEMVGSDDAFSRALQDYIREFGDRNVEELKLESKTFRTDPALLIRCILQYAESVPEPDSGAFAGACTDIPAGTGLSAFYAKKAALGIRNREKSRLHRGRLYGMMRSLVLQMGQNLYRQGRIVEPSDVFWLFCGEVEAAESDPALDLAGMIAGRKTEYSGSAALPPYSRLIFSGEIRNKHPRQTRRMCHDRTDSSYTGPPCSPGIAEGEALLVTDPSPMLDTKGKILVTKMTDPGWVFLIAPAKAIVSEKDSLLSHTAIISRELKKPAVVGIEHISEYLKSGDRIRVDGDRGIVTLLSRTEMQRC